MKTKIITLESHDNLISVRDKLSWAKTPRILLVWPKYEKVNLRLLDLKVLQRHADSLGAQLGLVTRWNNVKRDAESLNIPVFDSTTAAQKQVWHESLPRSTRLPSAPKPHLRKRRDELIIKPAAWTTSLMGRVGLFSVGVLAVLVLAGLFIPRATIILHPQSQVVSVVIPVRANPNAKAVSLGGDVPVQIVNVTVRASQTKTVTNEINIPTSKAKGFVEFENLSANEVAIPAGTVIATQSGIRFATLNRSLLPAGDNAIVQIPIQAIVAGESGNVNVNEITAIEGPLGLLMTVTNPEATAGGEDVKAIGASEAERIALREIVLIDLKTLAEMQMRSVLTEKDFLIVDTLELKEILVEEFSPPENEAGTSLTLEMQADFGARYIFAEDIQTLTFSSVTASIPLGFLPANEMTLDLFSAPVTDAAGVTYFELQANQNVLKQIDVLQVFNIVRGMQVQNAKTELATTFNLREAPQISMSPSWWGWLPLIPFNTSVEVR